MHELHIWRLDQKKAIASAHVVLDGQSSVSNFMDKAKLVSECLHAYGIHSATLQPELGESADNRPLLSERSTVPATSEAARSEPRRCQILCGNIQGNICGSLMCCNSP